MRCLSNFFNVLQERTGQLWNLLRKAPYARGVVRMPPHSQIQFAVITVKYDIFRLKTGLTLGLLRNGTYTAISMRMAGCGL